MEEKEMESLSIPGHPHSLKLSRLEKDGEKCKVCEKELLSPIIYSCGKCKFFICRSCGNLPQKIHHPFHPQHILVLCNKVILSCNACAVLDSGYGYDCNQCMFCLHLKCAALRPTEKNEALVQQSQHEHPLFLCEKPPDNSYECFRCHSLIQDDYIFVCFTCNYMLHPQCVVQPNEIRHPFHPQHPLKLLPRAPLIGSDCSLCNMGLGSYTSVYNCFSCNFNVDVHCATLVPFQENSVPDQEHVEIHPATHPHPLIQCYSKTTNFSHGCYACGQPFEESNIYVCLQCGILLHKSCADLPREILNPFHPEHLLALFENSTRVKIYHSSSCHGCGKGTGYFVYICQHCNFLLDLRCATTKFVTIYSDFHQHAHALFDIETKEFECKICPSKCSKFFFRCVKCNHNIHFHCHPSLPKTVKHDCHCDPLNFTTSQIKDIPDEDEEQDFYCNACEERRDLADPSYYCEECHFVAHVHCVTSEILPHLQRQHSKSNALDDRSEASTSGLERDDATAQCDSETITTENAEDVEIVQKLDAEIAALEEEIDAMTEELEELWDIRRQQASTLMYMIKKKIRLTGNSQEAEDIWSYSKYSDNQFFKFTF